jgi:hypothetical protein
MVGGRGNKPREHHLVLRRPGVLDAADDERPIDGSCHRALEALEMSNRPLASRPARATKSCSTSLRPGADRRSRRYTMTLRSRGPSMTRLAVVSDLGRTFMRSTSL